MLDAVTFNRSMTGFDPEIFVVDGENTLIPAFNFLPPKTKPLPIVAPKLDWGDGMIESVQPGAYWDGFQAEFNTRPYRCHGWALDQVRIGIQTVLREARKFDKSAKLTIQNVFEFTPDYLFKYPVEYVELGCDPSYNAYRRDPFEVSNPFLVPVRMAGGHIHYSVPNLEIEEAEQVAKYLDWVIGIPTVGMFENFDNPIRRTYYGRAGEFRFPKYGIEYRTLSNAWLGHPAISNLVVDLGRWPLSQALFRRHVTPEDFGFTFEDIQAVIDRTDVAGARDLFQRSRKMFDKIIEKQYVLGYTSLTTKYFDPMERAVMEGVESVIPSFGDIESTWELSFNLWSHSTGAKRNTSWVGLCNSLPLTK